MPCSDDDGQRDDPVEGIGVLMLEATNTGTAQDHAASSSAHVRAVHQCPQLSTLLDRQLHHPSQQQDQSSPHKANGITGH